MATSLKNSLPIIALGYALGFCASALGAEAEQLGDPTRPAIELVPGLTSAAASDAGKVTEAPPQGLQSVILSSKREAAIINGKEVNVGEKYGDAVLTVVNETCVVLMGAQGRQVMHMFPTVSMTKNELACVRKQAMQPIMKVAGMPVKKVKTRKKAKAKKRAVVCVPVEEIKDGSGK